MTQLIYSCGDNTFRVTMPDHHKAHEWSNGQPNSDAVNVHPRMFTMLRTTAIQNQIRVNVTPFYYIKDNEFKIFRGGQYNLTDHIPVTQNYQRLVLLGLDTDTNELTAIEGTEMFFSAATPPPLPNPIPSNVIPSALIRLRYNALQVTELDITDARTMVSAPVAGEGVSDGKVKVSSDDTTPDYLSNKISTSDVGLTIIVANDGSDETLTIDRTAPFPHGVLDHDDGVGSDPLAGDLIYGRVVGENIKWDRLAIGDEDEVLTVRGVVPTWVAPTLPTGVDPAGHTHSKLVASDGSPDPALSSDAAGNITIPTGNLGISVGDITVGNTSNPTKDIYLGGDEAGMKQRLVNIYQSATNMVHFDTTFGGWTWAAYTGFVTPNTIDLTSHPSMGMIHLSGGQTVPSRAFAYRASFGSDIHCNVALTVDCRGGLRMDDGTNNNYAEIFLESASSGLIKIRYRFAVGGVVTGPTDIWTTAVPVDFVHLRLLRSGDSAVFAWSMRSPRDFVPAVATITSWSPSRSGIYYEQLSGANSADRSAVFDWYRQ